MVNHVNHWNATEERDPQPLFSCCSDERLGKIALVSFAALRMLVEVGTNGLTIAAALAGRAFAGLVVAAVALIGTGGRIYWTSRSIRAEEQAQQA